MKSKNLNQTDKKQKQSKPQQNKTEEKPKEKKLVSSSSTDKGNIKSPNINQSNQKSKKNNELTDSKDSQPMNYKKIDTNQKNERKRVFSAEKDRNAMSPKKNETKNKKGRNLSMDKNLNKSQDSLKSPTYMSTKSNKNKNKKKEEKPDPLIENYDPNLYGFNLYKHIKENLSNKEKLCKDKLTKDSLYCIDCKISTCKKCPSFNSHNGHNLVPKYIYYEPDSTEFSDTFTDIDKLVEEDSDYMDNQKLKEELKKTITDSINGLTKRLNEIKSKKLKELDKYFDGADDCMKILKEREAKIKKDLKDYLKKQKDFYCIEVKEENEEKEQKEKMNNNLITNQNNDDLGVVQGNDDTFNTTFLTNYDLMKNSAYINGQIIKYLKDIKENKDKYLKEFTEIINLIKEDIEKLNKSFNGKFNYGNLSKDFYKMISDKLNKYNEKIDAMKKYIFDMLAKDGNFDAIEKDNKVTETHIKQKLENIINFQMDDKEEDPVAKAARGKGHYHRLSMYANEGLPPEKLQNIKILTTGSKDGRKGKGRESKIQGLYSSPDDVRLDRDILQKYSAYETFNTVHNHFRYKKPKKKDKEDVIMEELLDDEVDIVKPIAGTNEMQLFDKKNTTLTRRKVEFEKKKHKYLYFLNGCRTVLVKDMLFILGGVDKENKPTKVAYVYYIKTNELKPMPDMLKPHAYHSVEYLDYYRSIIVLGGENSSACEIFDLSTSAWKELPDMNIPRAHCNLYLDKFSHVIYTFFGVIGDITEKNNYTDVIECLELRRLALGWSVIDYENKAEMDFKSGYNKILPLSNDMILIYGAKNMRNIIKKAAVYLIPKFEIVKIDNRIFREIKQNSIHSRKLSKILTTYI